MNNIDILNEFENKLVNSITDGDPQFYKTIDKHFWDLTDVDTDKDIRFNITNDMFVEFYLYNRTKKLKILAINIDKNYIINKLKDYTISTTMLINDINELNEHVDFLKVFDIIELKRKYDIIFINNKYDKNISRELVNLLNII